MFTEVFKSQNMQIYVMLFKQHKRHSQSFVDTDG